MPIDLENDPRDPTTHRSPGRTAGSSRHGEPESDAKTDGRHARSQRSRQAMVDALLDLLRAGNLRPSSAQIAEHAGVTQRTLFNQFGDMDSLISAVATRQLEHVAGLLPEAATGPLPVRVQDFCTDLAGLLEETMHVRWAVLSSTPPIPLADIAVNHARGLMRERLGATFEPELAGLEAPDADALMDALEIECDPAVWRMRRLQQGLSVDRAQAAVARALLALVRDARLDQP